jgi:electron transfer flavoprotein beta subunit
MNILVACKIVPDSQDIKSAADGSLDFSKAHQTISEYDLNAIEAAAQLAAANPGSTVKAISVGGKKVDDSKVKKGVLARGVDELFLVADDAAADLDSAATAAELAKLAEAAGGYDVIVVGSGSADLYAGQVGIQLAAVLDAPFVSGVIELTAGGAGLICKRMLESTVETVEAPLPVVVSVLPDAALPRIAGMKDILAAGKKPMNVSAAQAGVASTVQTVSVAAPEPADRACEVFTDVDAFVAAVKAAL